MFASCQSGGLGFCNLFVDQGIAHILKLIQTLRTPGQPNLLLCIALRWWQVLCGAGYPLLQFPSRACPHQEGNWLRSTREFLADENASIETSFVYHDSALRTNDVSIMDTLSSSGHFSKTRLRQLNYCPLYLHVMFLSELVTTDGTHLIDGFWNGDFDRRTSSALF